MEAFLKSLVFNNIQRKLVSIIIAIAIWGVVSASIVSTYTFSKIPVRVVNLPSNKTIRGISPDGVLEKKISLTLTGETALIEKLMASSFEVVIDAANKGDEWNVQITPKNLVSYDSELEISNKIQQVTHNEFIVHLSRVITAKVPISILPSKNSAPEGYQLLDVWPKTLFHTVTGIEEEVKKLEEDGLSIAFDAAMVSKEELDALRIEQGSDEICFYIPDSWKKVRVPFAKGVVQALNCPEAKQLSLHFLSTECLPILNAIPVRIFFPIAMLDMFNPANTRIGLSESLRSMQGLFVIDRRLYTQEVSKLFLDLVRENIEIIIVPEIGKKGPYWHCETQVINARGLEDQFVAMAKTIEEEVDSHHNLAQISAQREQYLRLRFREYIRRFKLYSAKDVPFMLQAARQGEKLIIREVSSCA